MKWSTSADNITTSRTAQSCSFPLSLMQCTCTPACKIDSLITNPAWSIISLRYEPCADLIVVIKYKKSTSEYQNVPYVGHEIAISIKYQVLISAIFLNGNQLARPRCSRSVSWNISLAYCRSSYSSGREVRTLGSPAAGPDIHQMMFSLRVNRYDARI